MERVRIHGRDDLFLVIKIDEAKQKVSLLPLRYDSPDEVNVAFASLDIPETLEYK